MAREQLMRPPPSQPAGPPPSQPAGPPPAQPAGPPPAQPTSRVASQNPTSSRASLKRPRSDDEEPPPGPKRRFSARLAARSRSATASMSPLANKLELGGTEDVGAPDLSGPMEVDDGGEDEGGDDAFDPMEVGDGDGDSEYEEGK
ncbi:hypothetical protein VSDG_01034 [Cytospora chrysosperma]|uniref:Uncharacterized protein n=1 Tax=Cytospora chrysosperma TaxID=252740 RepID=A0A423WLI8_CYTCH|nr:hypothetical protein VSDG_01034 [Valsa sordida]